MNYTRDLYHCEDKHRNRIVSWDESDHPYTKKIDIISSKVLSYTGPSLGSTTRDSRHTIWVYGTIYVY